jgi:hypothetical protein
MSERHPRIRLERQDDEGRFLCLRESVSICFYMRRSHQDVAQAVLRSLEVYHRAVGPLALGWYADPEGDWQPLDDRGWELQRRSMLDPQGAQVELCEQPDSVTGHQFTYRGWQLDNLPFAHDRGAVCTVAFWLPTEFLEAHGAERLRALALELSAGLPFNSGHAGLSFQYFSGSRLGTEAAVRALGFRYPGLDIPDANTSTTLGTRVKGVHWLTFLGQPVLGELGGAAGLRARLHSADTSVQELEDGRAVVTLGPWPEAGDTERGHLLPAYRELALVLEPWLDQGRRPVGGFTAEDMRRWERRFLP